MSNRIHGAKQIARGSHRHAQTDTSAFIWGVLKHNGYRVPAQPWTTYDMLNSRGLKRISAKQAKRGNVAVVPSGDEAHSVILLQRYHGAKTKVLEDGGYANNVNLSTIGKAWNGVPKGLTFAEPIK